MGLGVVAVRPTMFPATNACLPAARSFSFMYSNAATPALEKASRYELIMALLSAFETPDC